MKIKLAILENDVSYLRRIVSVFETRYADKFEIYSFTSPDVAVKSISEARIDVLVSSDAFDIDVKALPKRCGFAYFVESSEVNTYNGQCAICKFQKVDLIYKQILSIYSEKAENISGIRTDSENTTSVLFCPASGGAGASTAAAAFAMRMSAKGKRVIYINLEKFGVSDTFFSGEGQFDMSDIIFALKGKKTNLQIKLESSVKQAQSGVYFYSGSKIALDMLELNADDILRFISELKLSGAYDYLVIDADFSLDRDMLKICGEMQRIVWVGDGSEISNTKVKRAFAALSLLERSDDSSTLVNRIVLMYNKFSSKTGSIIEDPNIRSIGGAPRFESATTAQAVLQLANMEMLDRIMQ